MAATKPAACWGLIKEIATSWGDDYVPSMGQRWRIKRCFRWRRC